MSTVSIDWREQPVPLVDNSASALDYHEIKIDLSNPISDEPLVRANQFNLATSNYYGRKDGLNPPYGLAFSEALKDVWMRESVARRLVMVNEILRPYRVEICLLDCYRPIELQIEVWKHFIERAKTVLTDPSETELVEYAGQYCSNPSSFSREDQRTWPTHTTGGAVDLNLRAIETKEHLFFGSIFDDATEISYTDHFERKAPKSSSELEARANRRLLFWAMISVGFSNYPLEWWHYDIGTQMWVMNSSDSDNRAYYGYIESPE